MVSEAGIHIANPMVLANLGRLGSVPVKCDQLDQYSDHFALLIEKSSTRLDIRISKSKEVLERLKKTEEKSTIILVKKLIKQIQQLQRSQVPKDREKLKQICSGDIQLVQDTPSTQQEQTPSA